MQNWHFIFQSTHVSAVTGNFNLDVPLSYLGYCPQKLTSFSKFRIASKVFFNHSAFLLEKNGLTLHRDKDRQYITITLEASNTLLNGGYHIYEFQHWQLHNRTMFAYATLRMYT